MQRPMVDGVVARQGDQFFTGDVAEGVVHYQVLCRAHYRSGQLHGDGLTAVIRSHTGREK